MAATGAASPDVLSARLAFLVGRSARATLRPVLDPFTMTRRLFLEGLEVVC